MFAAATLSMFDRLAVNKAKAVLNAIAAADTLKSP